MATLIHGHYWHWSNLLEKYICACGNSFTPGVDEPTWYDIKNIHGDNP